MYTVIYKILINCLLASEEEIISMTNDESYIKVPGWKRGHLSLHFRTTENEGQILVQSDKSQLRTLINVALISGINIKYFFIKSKRFVI